MYSDNEIMTARDLFYVEKEILMMQLKDMLEKTKRLEDQLIREIRSQQSETDFYKPTPGVEEPLKKRIKTER
jgi:hypothetical protein